MTNDSRIADSPTQQELLPAKHGEIDGIEMGVLPDGTPYLSSTGLAKLCGVAKSVIFELTSDWAEQATKPRGKMIRKFLINQGHPGDRLAIPITVSGTSGNAHPDSVCMAILEYYAFEQGRETALRAYRLLARQSFRQFIYERVGYRDPKEQAWANFQDLVSLNLAPKGYFSVFQESSSLIVTAIRRGLPLSPHTVPDGSIGIRWAKHWGDNSLEGKYGERRRHPHYYPESYPQSRANIDAWVYPVAALGEYRQWFEDVYIPDYYPVYLQAKAKKGDIDPDEYRRLLLAVEEESAHRLPE